MKLEWIPLYTELAQALLSCKNDRKPLVDWIYSDISQVGEKHGLKPIIGFWRKPLCIRK